MSMHGLGDDVGHAASLCNQLVDELRRPLGERGAHDHLVQPGRLGRPEARRIRVIRVPEDGNVGIVSATSSAGPGRGRRSRGPAGRCSRWSSAGGSRPRARRASLERTGRPQRAGSWPRAGAYQPASVAAMPVGQLHTVARVEDLPGGSALWPRPATRTSRSSTARRLLRNPGQVPRMGGPLGRGGWRTASSPAPGTAGNTTTRTGENVFDRAITLETYDVVVEDGEVKVVV